MNLQDNKPFQFIDRRQERIYRKLLEISPGPAAFFKDACRMWEDDPPLEGRTHYIAHALREIESAVRAVMLPLDYKVTEEVIKAKQTQKDQIEYIFSRYSIDPESEIAKLWLRIADEQEEIALYQFVHRNALGAPKSSDGSFKDLWDGVQALFDTLLKKMESNYIGYFKTLDGLLAKKSVLKDDINTLKNKIPNSPVTYNYFFEKLDNPIWLSPLKKAGFFRTPPLPIEHPEGGTSYPNWPQSNYLKKMAILPDKQDEILSIALQVESENLRVRSDLLEIALLLPVEMSIQIIESVGKVDNFLSPAKYGKLIKYFSLNGKTDKAVELANKVLSIQPDPRPAPVYDGHKINHDPVSIIREYDYEKIIEKDFPEFVDASGIDAVNVLLGQIDNYIKLSDADREEGSKDDLSYIWRPSIEDSNQNHKNGIRDVLITGARDMCERLLTKKPDQMESLLANLEARKLFILKRLALHLLRLFPKGSEDKVIKILLNEEEFGEEQRLTHEYFLLVQSHSKLLSPEQRSEIWSWMQKGGEVDMDAYNLRCKELKVEPSGERVAKYKKEWQLYHLLPFKEIDPDWKKYYEELVVVVGEPEFPSYRSWSGESSWGYKSGISEEQYINLKPNEIVELLREIELPKEGDPFDTSREGTARSLSSQLADNPARWSDSLILFVDLDPTYVRAVLEGHREALRQSRTFNWKPVLDLCVEILKKPIAVNDRKPSGFFADDPDWNWTRNSIAELITEGLQNDELKIPIQLKEVVWKIIEALTHDANPTPEEELKQLESKRDPLTIAVSSTRGDAIQAAIRYGIWLKGFAPEDDRKDWSLTKKAPELLKVLDEHLDTKVEPSVSIRSLYGERLGNLAWLDTKWVEENIPKIFPLDPKEQKYFDASWETYISFNHAYDSLLPMLIPQYQKAIKEMGSHSEGKHRLGNPDQNLVHHLILFYCRGKIPLNTGLMKDLYDYSSLEMKAEAIDFIGRTAKELEMSDKVRVKFVELAENRLATIKTSKVPHIEIQEFRDFSWWIYSEKFDDKWSLDFLTEALKLGCDIEGDHLIIERFVVLAPIFPKEVITSIELMVENDKKGWGVPTWGGELNDVIKQVLNDKDETARTMAKEFIHRLVARGYPEFKDTLPTDPE